MDRITFKVNGSEYSVGCEEDSDTSLNDYLRNRLNLRGTKYMCSEGGCGACVVAVTAADHCSGDPKTFSVNSCLVSILSCQNWSITTIEDIGNRKKKYHPIQKTLAEYNGTQCGYCTPGWVMSMYSLLENKNGELTKAKIENSFGSNVCRCTGYRPILDAFKSFATDAKNALEDIEDMSGKCKKSGKTCHKTCRPDGIDSDWCVVDEVGFEANPIIKITLKDNKKFYRVYETKDVFQIWQNEGYESYMLVAGNTAKGAYPILEYPKILIDISSIKELKTHQLDQNLILGSGMTLTCVMELFKELAKTEEYFWYLNKFADHLDIVAHIPVRNIGTVGGNLMIKHQHNAFPSDPFLLFETVGAFVTLLNSDSETSVSLPDFLKTDMSGKIFKHIQLPPLNKQYLLVTYKIMPRAQNAHAQVNSGFLYHMDKDNQTVLSARIVYGGLSPTYIHATKTEQYLIGKILFIDETLQGALKVLQDELIVEESPPEPSAKFRKKLALGLFYKGLLYLAPDNVINSRYKSGANNYRLTRPVSTGIQVYDTNKAVWPVNEPMPKLEALIQCAGEAPYVNDIPTLPREVFAAFVLTTVGKGEIDQIDASSVLAMPRVVSFFTAKDIPGKNSYQSTKQPFVLSEEEFLCNGTVKFCGQPLGIIVAESEKLANRAAKLVKVTYKNVGAPVLTIADAQKDSARVNLLLAIPATDRGLQTKKIIKSSNKIFGQYHFTMETQSCVSLPSEDGLDVYSATQWLDSSQQSISEALLLDKNRINMSVTRLGGGYGSKISRSIQIALGSSLVAYLLNRPCRFVMTIEANMRAIGKRLPCDCDYEVGVDDKGEIQHMKYNIYDDNGYIVNEQLLLLGLPAIKNCYNRHRWFISAYNVITDNHSNTWCRAPGTAECIAMTEYVMEQICYELGLDPFEVRLANINKTETSVIEIMSIIREDSEYDKRKIEIKEFNKNNRWKKRGIRMVPMSWPIPITAYYDVFVAIYHGDGSVVITHGGIEMGQGINTKIAQICAYTLSIPLSMIKVKRTDILTSSNAMTTGGSITSEGVCFAVIKCCQQLLDRLSPIRVNLNNATWALLIQTAFTSGVLLHASYNYNANDMHAYRVAGAAVVETELDLLTGEHLVRRADVMEDVGQSLNPEIDVGQVEGAYMMAQGYWTSEELVYDKTTGELLTNRTWNYHIPGAKDIPIDFRIKFKRNSFNIVGVLGSKGTGEPAVCMGLAVAFALRECIAASRVDSGRPSTEWFSIDGAHTAERMILAADVPIEEFKLA